MDNQVKQILPVHEIGVMQGRLVPQINDRIQAFPWERWREEFELAKIHGFQSIEFIFEAERYQDNPLYTESGITDILTLVDRTCIPVSAICADYFMAHPFFRVSRHEQEENIRLLARLLERAANVGARRVEIPCVDAASILTEQDKQELISCISQCLSVAERYSIEIVFETDLPPWDFRAFIEQFRHPLVRANYDTGNSAALGYDPAQELMTLGGLVANIHIKDRILHGETVPLGDGAAKFSTIFATLAKIQYHGPFILQTARDPDNIGVALKYREIVRSYIQQYFV